MCNVDIQSNIIDNNNMQNYKLAISAMWRKLTRPEGPRLELQVLIHALKDRFTKAMPIKY